jgi:hypothetical protein
MNEHLVTIEIDSQVAGGMEWIGAIVEGEPTDYAADLEGMIIVRAGARNVLIVNDRLIAVLPEGLTEALTQAAAYVAKHYPTIYRLAKVTAH